MKLSEAIRLGSMLRPQSFGTFFSKDGGTCALAAAQEAGFDNIDVMTRVVESPFYGHTSSLAACVVNLNDHHRWTREQIADWVETVEPSETPDPDGGTSDLRGTETEDAVAVCAIRGSEETR